MNKITHIFGKSIPLGMDNVDTDLIIPGQYLTSVSKEGYGKNLFIRLRESDPAFVFNQPHFKDANILITQENFGCGSSREHAVWALQEAGIQAIAAISFADIFYSNAAKNGLLLIKLPALVINQLLTASCNGQCYLNIDIAAKTITTKDPASTFNFELDPFRQHCFINGLDDLDYLLTKKSEIIQYEQQRINNTFFIEVS